MQKLCEALFFNHSLAWHKYGCHYEKMRYMKKMILILPLAVLLANCSSSRHTDTAVASTDETTVTTTTTNDVTMSGAATVSPVWDYPGLYTSSYNPDLRSDLDGQWVLAMTPDLSASWLPDNTTS